VCLRNSVFYGMLGVGTTTTKFESQVVKFCCDNVCVENCVSEMKGYQLKPVVR